MQTRVSGERQLAPQAREGVARKVYPSRAERTAPWALEAHIERIGFINLSGGEWKANKPSDDRRCGKKDDEGKGHIFTKGDKDGR